MMEGPEPSPPGPLAAIERDTSALGFKMASDRGAGSLLRTLAATKPGGAFLELGTGTGLSAAWLLSGMDSTSTLLSVDNDEGVVAVARRHLEQDSRVTFAVADGAACLSRLAAEGRTFDLVFADAWPGKYTHLDEALQLLRTGGLYVIDDMLPQPNWPVEHPPKVVSLLETLGSRADLRVTALAWSTGVVVAAKVR